MENTIETLSPTPAESSPEATLSIPRSGTPEYAEWRNTGTLAEAKQPKSEDSATSKETAAPENGEENAPDPASGKTTQERRPKPGGAEARLQELLADLKEAGLSPKELKTFKRQFEQPKAAETKPPVEQPKPEHTAKPAEGPPQKPKLEDFKTYEEHEEAKDKWHEEMAEWKANQAVEKFKRDQAESEALKTATQKLAEAEQRYGGDAKRVIVEAGTAIFTDKSVAPAVRAIIDGSPVTADLIYALASDPEAWAEFLEQSRTDPGAAIRRAVVVEDLCLRTLKGDKSAPAAETPERDEHGQFKPAAPARKKTSDAPPPPSEVSGRAAAPGDPVEDAVSRANFRAFREAQNAKDLAQRRGM